MPSYLLRHLAARVHEEQLGRNPPPLVAVLILLRRGGLRIVLLDAQVVYVRPAIVAHRDHALVGGVPLEGGDGGAVGAEAGEGVRRDGRIGRFEVAQVPYGEGAFPACVSVCVWVWR